MQDNKINVVHFHNGSGGGVLSVIANLLRFSANLRIINHVIYTINKNLQPNYQPPELAGAVSTQVFYYRPEWNFYYTCRQLAKKLPCKDAVIVAHDWLELGMVSNLGLQNPVVHVVHGDYQYYLDLAVKHSESVNHFVTVSDAIKKKLVNLLPERTVDISYARFPVPESVKGSGKETAKISIIFVGRCSKEKGYDLLPQIAEAVHKNGVQATWHIVGTQYVHVNAILSWAPGLNIKFYGERSTEFVQSLLPGMDIFVLPSRAEGIPVSIIEAMKAGVVPIVNHVGDGLSEIITTRNGYLIANNEVDAYVNAIKSLSENSELRKEKSEACQQVAVSLFDPMKNTVVYELIFLDVAQANNERRRKQMVYGSRLDREWLPNAITTFIRTR